MLSGTAQSKDTKPGPNRAFPQDNNGKLRGIADTFNFPKSSTDVKSSVQDNPVAGRERPRKHTRTGIVGTLKNVKSRAAAADSKHTKDFGNEITPESGLSIASNASPKLETLRMIGENFICGRT